MAENYLMMFIEVTVRDTSELDARYHLPPLGRNLLSSSGMRHLADDLQPPLIRTCSNLVWAAYAYATYDLQSLQSLLS